jgi:hypothetical protein
MSGRLRMSIFCTSRTLTVKGPVAVAKRNDQPVLALTLRLPWESPQAMWRHPIDFKMEREGLEPSTPALRARSSTEPLVLIQ